MLFYDWEEIGINPATEPENPDLLGDFLTEVSALGICPTAMLQALFTDLGAMAIIAREMPH